jgi:hypothetical protein
MHQSRPPPAPRVSTRRSDHVKLDLSPRCLWRLEAEASFCSGIQRRPASRVTPRGHLASRSSSPCSAPPQPGPELFVDRPHRSRRFHRSVDRADRPEPSVGETSASASSRAEALASDGNLACDATQHPSIYDCVNSFEPLRPARGHGEYTATLDRRGAYDGSKALPRLFFGDLVERGGPGTGERDLRCGPRGELVTQRDKAPFDATRLGTPRQSEPCQTQRRCFAPLAAPSGEALPLVPDQLHELAAGLRIGLEDTS